MQIPVVPAPIDGKVKPSFIDAEIRVILALSKQLTVAISMQQQYLLAVKSAPTR